MSEVEPLFAGGEDGYAAEPEMKEPCGCRNMLFMFAFTFANAVTLQLARPCRRSLLFAGAAFYRKLIFDHCHVLNFFHSYSSFALTIIHYYLND